MADNPIETAAAELKKWLEQLQAVFKALKEQEAKLAAEQKAIGEKALAANKEMMAAEANKAKHDALMKELKGLREKVNELPDGDAKKALSKDAGGLAAEVNKSLSKDDASLDKINEINPDLKADAPKLGAHRRSVGEDLKDDGFSKDAKGWKKGEIHVKGASQKVSAPAANIKMPVAP
jgi:small-conductance mechanosensitive channel